MGGEWGLSWGIGNSLVSRREERGQFKSVESQILKTRKSELTPLEPGPRPSAAEK